MKFKIPSIHSLWTSIQQVIIRFPLQVLVAVAATGAWCYLVGLKGNEKFLEEALVKFIAISNLALTLLLSGDLYAEVNSFTTVKKWGLRLLGAMICTGLYFLLDPSFYLADVYRIALLAFAFHLLVAFAPFIGKGNLNGFWQYNKSLFLRILTSALYAGVLYAGLAIALLAIDGLFNVTIGWQTYMRLFIVVSSGFMTIFFLAGIPEDFTDINKADSYPKGLKIFTQYVLIPLMTIYLVILLVYEVKIMMNWELPKGLVSMLILGYAVFGILSLLLIYPIKDKEGNGWIKLFSKFFYVMMVPLVILLLLAVWKRVGNYGITESRYILIILAVWLSLITAYFLLSKKQNIKIIPISLCVLALLSVYGPQSAFSISRYSQLERLRKLMSSEKQENVKQRSEVIDYLVDRHGLSSLQSFTKVNLVDLEQKMLHKGTESEYIIKSAIADTAYALLKVKRDSSVYQENVTFVPENNESINVKGYDFMISINNYNGKTTAKINGMPVVAEILEGNKNLRVSIDSAVVTEFDINRLIKDAVKTFKAEKLKEKPDGYKTFYLPEKSLTLVRVLNKYDVAFVVSSIMAPIDAENNKERNMLANYNGYLLIRVK